MLTLALLRLWLHSLSLPISGVFNCFTTSVEKTYLVFDECLFGMHSQDIWPETMALDIFLAQDDCLLDLKAVVELVATSLVESQPVGCIALHDCL